MTDIDILLSNTSMAMAVDVKRMELIRRYPPAEVAGKKMLGAMAGGVVNADVQRYAHENGFFVLELVRSHDCNCGFFWCFRCFPTLHDSALFVV
jgi:hypothetical protein